MKKTLPLLLCLVLLAGCAGEKDPIQSQGDTETAYYTALGETQEDACGVVVFLGGANDDVADWHEKLPAVFPDAAEKDLGEIPVADFAGYEAYLIVPRYEGESVKLTEMTMDDSGKIVETGRTETATGPVILLCNPSDLYSNAYVELKLAADEGSQTVQFTPFFSLKDGSLVTDKRVPSIVLQ